MRRARALLAVICVAAGSALGGCVGLRPVATARAGLPAELFLATSAGTVHLEQTGAGPPVVLIHGFGGSLYSWREVAPRLAAAGFRVIAVDLFGFGLSERPEDADAYSPEGQARLVLEVVDRLGLGAIHLVGHSFGGGVALSVAASDPKRLLSLVLVDSTLPTHSRAPRADLPLFRPAIYALIRTVGLRRLFVKKALEKAFYDDRLVTRELVDAYRDRLLLRGPASPYLGLTAPVPRRRLAVRLESIAVPTLVVWGEEDALIPVAAGRRAAQKIPGARFEAIPACGHIPMEEAPEAFLEAVLPFLQEGGRGQAPPLPAKLPSPGGDSAPSSPAPTREIAFAGR